MVEIWEEEGQQDSEWRDGPDVEIGSPSFRDFVRNFPMYSPPRLFIDWYADQVQSPPQRSLTDWSADQPLDLFGLQFGYEAYLPPATSTLCIIEASLLCSNLDLLHSPPRSFIDWCADQVQSPPQRSLTDWSADQVQSPPLDLFGPQFGNEAYLPPATSTLCIIGASLLSVLCSNLDLHNLTHLTLSFRHLEARKPVTLPFESLTCLYSTELCFCGGGAFILEVVESGGLIFGVTFFHLGIEIGYLIEKENNALVTLQLHSIPMWSIFEFQEYSLEGRCVEANNVMVEKLNLGFLYIQTFQRQPGVGIIQLDSSKERIFGELGAKNIGQKVESAEKSCIAISHSKKKNTIETPKRKYRTKRLITLDDLRQLFGRKRVDAAKILGVSVPTFKRCCRKNGIRWWNGDGCFPVELKLLNNSVHQNLLGSKPPEVQGKKEISALLGARQDAVTIKAKYEEGILKFQLSSESGFAELHEAVAKRLKSQAFIVEYEDEVQELIMISCDEDWQACVNFFGNQVIRLAIREKISNSKKSHGSGRGLKRKSSKT